MKDPYAVLGVSKDADDEEIKNEESVVEPLHIMEPGDYENWPQEAKDIMADAGIEEEYKKNFNIDAPKVLACDDRRQSLSLETPTWSGLYILGGKNAEYNLKDYDLDLWVDDPEALELTEDGYFIAHKAGLHEAEVAVTFNGVTHMQHFKLECGDDIERLALSVDNINIIKGASVNLSVVAYTTFDNVLEITSEAEIDLVADEPIIELDKHRIGTSVRSEVTVKPLADKGDTTLRGTIKYGDIVQEVVIPVRIIRYASSEGASLPFKKINVASGWKNPGTPTEDGGTYVVGLPNHYGTQFENELIAFDMMIQPGNSWPGFVICDSDPMGDYKSNDCYMFAFKNTFIELQRFNQGARTVVCGDNVGDAKPIVGPGIPNVEGEKIFEYGKRYSIVVGALETDEGTRLILNINGKNILDFTDSNERRLPAHGFFAHYNPSNGNGGTTYWEYSGITE